MDRNFFLRNQKICIENGRDFCYTKFVFCVQLAKKHFPKGEDNAMTIDVEKLRETLKQECYGAFFGGGFGGALVESFDLEGASPEELVAVALDKEIDLSKYQT